VSRPWCLTKEAWISDVDILEKTATPFFGDSSKQDKDSKEKKAKLPSVTADEAQPICPKCGERFEQYFDSEQDEWMYRDTVRVENTIYHQKCSIMEEQDNSTLLRTPPHELKEEKTAEENHTTLVPEETPHIITKEDETNEVFESSSKKPRVT